MEIYIFVFQLKGIDLELCLVRGHVEPTQSDSSSAGSTVSNGPGPFCRFVNVELCNAEPQAGAKGTKGTVLLENPRGDFPVSVSELKGHVKVIFGLQGRRMALYKSKSKSNGECVVWSCW